jgi:hypothetical protein
MSNKNSRKKRKLKKLKNHVAWLKIMHGAGVALDMEKIIKTKNPKLLVDKLISSESKK